MNNNSEYSLKSTAHIKNLLDFRINNYLRDRVFIFDDPVFQYLDSIVEETFEDCLKCFHRFQYKFEYIVKFVRVENVQNVARILQSQIDIKNYTQSMNKMYYIIKSMNMNKEKVVIVLIV